MDLLIFDPIERLLLALAGALLVVQALYYFCLYNRIHLRNRLLKRRELHFSQELPPLSVIITASDECDSLRKNLASVLEQDYPDFEVIVINDGKADESADYLTLLEDSYSNLYHSFVPDSSRYISRKKLAISLGIKAAKHDWLVLTDADCRPASDQWLRLMARNFTSRTEVVLGYSGYDTGKGWLHKRAAFDNLFTSMRYLGFALAGNPYMGIGRNLAYRKELFYKQGGFSNHLNLRCGDDDLFVNHVANGENTRVECQAEACVHRRPLRHRKEWREEKVERAVTARFLHGFQRYLLGLETTSRLLFYLCWVAAAAAGVLTGHWMATVVAVVLFLLRFAMQAAIINLSARDLGEERRYYASLVVMDWAQAWQSLCWKLSRTFRKKQEFLRK